MVWLQTSIWSNRFKTIYLISLMPIIVFLSIVLWYYLSYWNLDEAVINEIISLFLFSLPIILIWFFIAIFFQKQIIFSFSGAREITRKENPEIYNIVENLCISRWLPTPIMKKAKWITSYFWSLFSTHPSIEARIQALENY